MPNELGLEREAIRQQVLRQIGAEGRYPRVTQGQVRMSDLEGDILALPDFPAEPLQIFDPASAHFGKQRFIWGVTRFNDADAVLV